MLNVFDRILFDLVVPVKEPVEKMYDHETILGKAHEVIVSNGGQG